MRARCVSKFLAGATLLLLCANALSAPVRFARRGHLIVVPVTVNGAEPCAFMLDTGASTTLVTPEFARQLRLRPLDRIELVTVAGSQIVVRAQLDSVSVATHTAAHVETLISELREMRAIEPKLCGVLGQNFLAQFNYLIDYDAQQLEFESGTEIERRLCGSRWPFAWHGERWLVTLPLNQWSWRFVPDSGLAALLLFGERKLDWSPVQHAEQRLRTDSGSFVVQPRYVRSLRLGGVEFRDLSVTTLAKQAGRIEEGLLPLSLFRRVYFNHRRHYLILNPIIAEKP